MADDIQHRVNALKILPAVAYGRIEKNPCTVSEDAVILL